MSDLPVKRRGRPRDPNSLIFRTVGLPAWAWEWVAQWALEDGSEGANLTPAMGRLCDELRRLAPGGPGIGKARDAKGRFVPEGGTSKGAKTRARKRAQEVSGG